jgi:thioredoxin reductase
MPPPDGRALSGGENDASPPRDVGRALSDVAVRASPHDVVVVGGGAAGLSAALVLGRARRRVAVIDAGAPRNAPAAHMHGFLSRDGLPPTALLAAGRAEVNGYGVDLIEDRVVGIEPGFRVRLAGGRTLETRRILIATGARDELPEVPGVRERWGRDLLHCPYCHGWEVRDQPIGILGTNAGGAVARLVLEDDRLAGVELVDGRIVPRTAVFVRPVNVPHPDGLLAGLGCDVDVAGFAVVDATGRTSTAGVWAAGNVVDPRLQVISSAGAGSVAAIAINADLVADDTESA